MKKHILISLLGFTGLAAAVFATQVPSISSRVSRDNSVATSESPEAKELRESVKAAERASDHQIEHQTLGDGLRTVEALERVERAMSASPKADTAGVASVAEAQRHVDKARREGGEGGRTSDGHESTHTDGGRDVSNIA